MSIKLRIFNGMILIIKLYFTFGLILIISCNRNANNELIISFYKTKAEFLTPALYQKRDSLANELSSKWEQIMKNRKEIVLYLQTLEYDTSFTLYGNNYSEHYIIQKSPNNLHALYLIECILQDDYLFNRRYATQAGVGEYFRNDGFNFIYDTINGIDQNGIRLFSPINHGKYNEQFNKAWKIYEDYLNASDIANNAKPCSPIFNTSLRWYSMMKFQGDKANLDTIFRKKNNPLYKKFYHLDFKIGDRWSFEH